MTEHAMRRSKQLLSPDQTCTILANATSGTLAVVDADGFPYTVPLSFAFEEPAAGMEPSAEGTATKGTIWFHCAPTGHKLDAIATCDRASFCVIDADEIVPEEFTTYFRSAVAFGRVRVVRDDAERLHALQLMARKYSPGLDEGAKREIDSSFKHVTVLALDVERLTGKEAIELVRRHSSAG